MHWVSAQIPSPISTTKCFVGSRCPPYPLLPILFFIDNFIFNPIFAFEVNWNINLITRNKGIRKQEILLLEFCKNDPRILRPLQITFSRWNQIQIWLQEISGYNKQQEDCSICYFNFGPTGDPPLSNLKQPPTSADMPVLNSPLLSFIYVSHTVH